MSKRQIFSMIRQGGMGDGAARPDTTGIISLEQRALEYEQATRLLENEEHELELDQYATESLWDAYTRGEQMIDLARQLSTESNPQLLQQVHTLTCESLELFGVKMPSMESLSLESGSDEAKKGIFRRMMDALIALWRRIVHRFKMIFSPQYRREQKLLEMLDKAFADIEENMEEMLSGIKEQASKLDPMNETYVLHYPGVAPRHLLARGVSSLEVGDYMFDTSMIETMDVLVREMTRVINRPSDQLASEEGNAELNRLMQSIIDFRNHTPRSPWRKGVADTWSLHGRLGSIERDVIELAPGVGGLVYQAPRVNTNDNTPDLTLPMLSSGWRVEGIQKVVYGNAFGGSAQDVSLRLRGREIMKVLEMGKRHAQQAERFYDRLERLGVSKHIEECQRAVERHRDAANPNRTLSAVLQLVTTIVKTLVRLVAEQRTLIGEYTNIYAYTARHTTVQSLKRAHEEGSQA